MTSVRLSTKPHDTAAAHAGLPARDTDQAPSGGADAAQLLALTRTTTQLLAEAWNSLGLVNLAAGTLMDRYTMSETAAHTLISQLARQDGVSKATAARDLLAPDALR